MVKKYITEKYKHSLNRIIGGLQIANIKGEEQDGISA